MGGNRTITLHWRHNGRNCVSNHQPSDCLLHCLFRCRSNKTSKLRVTGLCEGNSPVTGEFPAQMASNAENVSIWWRHHVMCQFAETLWLQSVQNRVAFIFMWRHNTVIKWSISNKIGKGELSSSSLCALISKPAFHEQVHDIHLTPTDPRFKPFHRMLIQDTTRVRVCTVKAGWPLMDMMTSSNGNTFHVTGHLCAECTGPGEFPAQRPVTRSFDAFFDLRLNKRLSKQWWSWCFETPLRPWWCHCNGRQWTYSTGEFPRINFDHTTSDSCMRY